MELVVIDCLVEHRQRYDCVPPQGLQDDRVDINQRVLVARFGQTVWAYDGIELHMGFLHDFWIERQC